MKRNIILIVVSILAGVFFLFQVELKAETPGQQILDPTDDVILPYINVTQLNSSIDGELLTVIFYLVDLPEELFFYRIGVPQSALEYAWSVYIDVDNDQQTGNNLDIFEGIDYTLSVMHFVGTDNADSNLEKNLQMELQCNIYKERDEGGFTWLEQASLTVNTDDNTLELSGIIPGITSNSNIYFETFDYNPEGERTSDLSSDSETSCSQAELDAQFEAGKQYCIDNPAACGISTGGGYTQSDLDAEYQSGYNAGLSECSDENITPATLSNGLDMHIPMLQFGTMSLWVDFVYVGESNGDFIWKLAKYGQK